MTLGLLCPLHDRKHCPCTVFSVELAQLDQPYTLGGWECVNGHRIVGPPTHNERNDRANQTECIDGCGERLRLVSVAIYGGAT